MLKFVRHALVACAALTLAGPTTAADLNRSTDGHSYFYKPGAQRADHDRDVWKCRVVGRQLRQEPFTPLSPRSTRYYVYESPLQALGVVGGEAIAAAFFQAIEDGETHRVALENCMVAHGWQVVVVPAAEAKGLSGKALQSALDQWVGAPQPHGVVARTFRNDVARIGTTRFANAIAKGSSLSGKAVGAPKAAEAEALALRPPLYLPQPPSVPRPPKGPPPVVLKTPLTAAGLAAAESPADQGLVAVRIDGGAAMTLGFERLGPDPATPSWRDGRPGLLAVGGPISGSAVRGKPEDTLVYALPPGRWRLASATVYGVTLSFCLGGPAFDVAAGEVIYAGALRSDLFTPDMDLGLARAAFPAGAPLAARLKPAQWLNGAQGRCAGSFAYVLELPDRPFLDGYALGSRAPGQVPPAAP